MAVVIIFDDNGKIIRIKKKKKFKDLKVLHFRLINKYGNEKM